MLRINLDSTLREMSEKGTDKTRSLAGMRGGAHYTHAVHDGDHVPILIEGKQ